MHIPVLLGETVESLALKEGSVVVDATLGAGGHSLEILRRIGGKGRLIALDVDRRAVEDFRVKIIEASLSEHRIDLVNDNFGNLEKILNELKLEKIDAVMADLGWRKEQIEDGQYGLSFQNEGPLDMRLNRADEEKNLTAEVIVNEWSEQELARIFFQYGEEKFSKRAAAAIINARNKSRIKPTTELSAIIKDAIGRSYKIGHLKINPATKIFQALRIVVNNELDGLSQFLPQALDSLRTGGRMAIITFHSLEDRIVKKFYQANARGCVCPASFPVCVCGKKPQLKIITKKPVVASENEKNINPRSRSAKLRVAEKIAHQ